MKSKQTLAGYPYHYDQRLGNYLEAFLFCVDNLSKYKHIPVSHLEGRWGLNHHQSYQVIARAEEYLAITTV